MKTRMKVASCLCAMVLMAGATAAWGGGFTASATFDFWNQATPPPAGMDLPIVSGNQITESIPGMITSVNAVVQSSSFDGSSAATPRPALPLASSTGIIGVSNAAASYDQMDPTASYYGNSHVVSAISSGPLPNTASDNVDWFAVAQNTVQGAATANGIVSFQFLFNVATLGDSVSVTANMIDLMQNVAFTPGSKFSAAFRYQFAVLDPATMLELDSMQFIRTYDTAAIVAANGGEILTQNTYVTPATLGPGQYYLLLEAEQTATSAVPEPGTFVLAGSGIIGLFLLRRRNSKK